jgi:HAE1 family hydrophobic/amphiphilic exporter-1
VAEVVETESIMNITHEDSKRRVAVLGEIDAERVTAVEIINKFKEEIKDYAMPEGVVLELGGEMEEMEESFENMMNNMILAAILVYIILAIQFNSLTQPLIILFAVPMALIGVMPGLVITGNKFGFVAFVGVVALVGIAVNDAIVLVDYINYLRGTGHNLKDAILETGKTRFLPVLATTITTAGGILPITLKEAFYAPLGIALICGLCMSTLLTLVIVPTMYSILEEHKQKRLNKKIKEIDNVI